MKITLSKSQWQFIGKQAGWMKISQDMKERMDTFFSPSITLKRHMLNGKVISGYWYVDLVKDLPIAKQLIEEAGIKNSLGTRISDADLDAFELAAGNRGYSIETIGE